MGRISGLRKIEVPHYRQRCGTTRCRHRRLVHKNGQGRCSFYGCSCMEFSDSDIDFVFDRRKALVAWN